MAKLIILEGLSRTGKTTIANHLRDNGYGRIVSIQDKMPQCEDLTSFYIPYSSLLKIPPLEVSSFYLY